MDCPFATPVEKEISTQNALCQTYYRINDANIRSIAVGLTEKNADYIVQAINSHEKLLRLLKMAECPNCDGSGAIPRQVSEKRCVTREMAIDGGDPNLEGSLYSDDEWDAEQCQWCDEKDQALKEAEKP